MPYCVNCGVELGGEIQVCPLCQTPVVHPDALEPLEAPFPQQRGEVERANKRDMAILTTVVIGSTAVACGILNFFVFKGNLWSLYVIGACFLIWVFAIPIMVYQKLPVFIMLLFDALAIALYCGVIAYRHPGRGWYLHIAVPIITLSTILILLFCFVTRWLKRSILPTATLVIAEAGVLCLGIEVCIRLYLEQRWYVSWSAVVAICCGIIVICLLTIIRRKNLREEVRRRMHF